MICARATRWVCAAAAVLFSAAWNVSFGAPTSLVWTVATSYPSDTVSGQSVRSFAADVTAATGRRLVAHPRYRVSDVAGKLLADVQSGRVQIASIFAGSLGKLDPIFELQTLPFRVHSIEDARRLTCLARERYEIAFSRLGLRLLFISPWPPSGLWSRWHVFAPHTLSGMRVRSYNQASTQILTAFGMDAIEMSAGEAVRGVKQGTLDAVLSSGDGEVGRAFAADIRNFTALDYAYPISFVVVRADTFDALPRVLQASIIDTSKAAERAHWDALPARIMSNAAAMRQLGVTVNTDLDPTLRKDLLSAGYSSGESWLARVPPEDAAVLVAYRHPPTPANLPCIPSAPTSSVAVE